ncbi:izumo sperm-egg fusion protein 2 isoform 3-T3 [Anomaloglossus baeobatrachus]|uniref:izumo sperm-egg fusion protein 2 isoform X3 n=1 Tax=Anomaloglossus baeobatrachus TaxID=238106 RepID=UPI003F4FDDAF
MDMPHRHLNVAQLYNMDTRLSAMIITTASSCLQCNSEIVYLFKRITNEAIPKFIKDPKLQRRADTLVNGMASNFFKDYAVKHFAGIIEIPHFNTLVDYILAETPTFLHSQEREQNFLDALMIFRNHTTMKFKHGLLAYHNKACSPTQCGWLKTDVFSCTNCVTVKPSCLSRSVCMGLHFSHFCTGSERSHSLKEQCLCEELKGH